MIAMMNCRKSITLTLALFSIFVFGGCFKIYEQVEFKSDGSGTFALIYEMAEVREFLLSQGGDPASPTSPYHEIKKDFETDKAILDAIPGISNIQIQGNPESYDLSLQFDFDDVDALNRALNHQLQDNQEETGDFTFYLFEAGVVTRTAYKGHLDDFRDEFTRNLPEINEDLSRASYRVVLKFQEEVSPVNLGQYIFSDDNREASLDLLMLKPEYSEQSPEAAFDFN